ncbi:PaaX family transcriptional regulator [Streptomyces roseirectus]|uniref:PaaX family transcriptional regulator n=1 Tax=Streptomyces roseirectus TaxID=2768066 RepID=A0A7H0I5M0_9ACTN|nr:PaaX family transcriptional regulator C-terminal domain-containing protein [Streptomyces roseirectus]QNP68086.1 PaaX family transcriptional regulator [Streptomyces roseirectus]
MASPADADRQARPQSLLLTFFGNHLLDEEPLCVYSGSVIDVLARTGVGEHAVRSTLSRMVNRGLLLRRRQGRRMYFGLTPLTAQILRDGRRRIWETSAVNDDWDGTWTLLGFSLPDAWQSRRHDLRSRLAWSGFGSLYNGLWIAPGHVDVSAVVAELDLSAHVKVFHARADASTDIRLMVRDTWDLDSLAARYTAFTARWTAPEWSASDAIAVRLRLVSEWLGIIRSDPRLPGPHLPADWPARAAETTFHRVATETETPARALASAILDTIPLNPA